MASTTRKTLLREIDAKPEKRIFLSIISDYDLKTGLCELVDNALDLWVSNHKKPGLTIAIELDPARQFIQVRDNAGGVREDQAHLLITPGASRNIAGQEIIGIFGVGGKRAGVALGEHVEIRTRYQNEKSLQFDITSAWLESPDWEIDLYEIPEIAAGTTSIEITKVRQGFNEDDVVDMREHLGATYSWFISQGCKIELNRVAVNPIKFDGWAFPPEFLPRQAQFDIEPVMGKILRVTLSAGLIGDRNPETENYGVYFMCNHRLVVRELRGREVGYVSGEAGVPHPDASMSRVIIELQGSADLMPWNSSKSGINFNHPAFNQIRQRVIDFNTYFTTASRRTKHDWEGLVLQHRTGRIELIDANIAMSAKKTVLPKLPAMRLRSYVDALKEDNAKLIQSEPWTLGLIESMGLVEILGRQKLETKNRAALILLDSNFEIALKEYIVSNKAKFPSHKYDNVKLAQLFKNRTEVIKEVAAHVPNLTALLPKVNHYYDLRNTLIHQRATVPISDSQVADYRRTIEQALTELFKVTFP